MTLALLLTHVFNANINVTIKTQYEDVLKFYFQVISLPSVWSSLLLHFSSWYCYIYFFNIMVLLKSSIFMVLLDSLFIICLIHFLYILILLHSLLIMVLLDSLLITRCLLLDSLLIMVLQLWLYILLNPFHRGIARFTSYCHV